jgi:two-component system cell cycle sensor histidine kinase PleC
VLPRAVKAGLSVATDIPEELQIVADATFLKRMLLNLLTNSVKFTPSGGTVTVSAQQIDIQGGQPTAVEIRVADTGIGMSPEEIEIALLPFRQVDGSLSRRHEGTGLGLPLAKSLAELHGGRLLVQSELGRGTTVRIVLPVKAPGNWILTPPRQADGVYQRQV